MSRQSTPEFAQAPLVESVFDVSIASANANRSQPFFETMQGYSGVTEDVHEIDLQFMFDQDGPSEASTRVREVAVRRWDSRRQRAVLVGAEVLAYNVLNTESAPYGHFEDHVPELTRLLARYQELNRPWQILRAGQRFINHVTIELEESISPALLFALYPALRDAHAKTHPPLTVQVEASRFPGGVVFATLSLPMKNPNAVIYALDVSAVTDGQPPNDVDGLIEWHRVAHASVREVFLASITDDARKRFKER
jgi:uncharacterized protein (TIGR04255 family)